MAKAKKTKDTIPEPVVASIPPPLPNPVIPPSVEKKQAKFLEFLEKVNPELAAKIKARKG